MVYVAAKAAKEPEGQNLPALNNPLLFGYPKFSGV